MVLASAVVLGAAAAAVAVVVTADQGNSDPAPGPNATDLPGRVVFRGDFNTGDLSQWDGVQRVAPNRIRVVRSPRAEGGYAARFEVRNGDNPITADDRAEVQSSTDETEGSDRWYQWSTMFAKSFPSVGAWQVVTQWHADTLNGSPSVGFYVYRNRIQLQVWRHGANSRPVGPPRVLWSGPLRRGQWQTFKLHVKWSGDDAKGLIQLWVNGRKVTKAIRTRTLYTGMGAYLKQGYYRQRGIRQTGVIYHDGLVVTEVKRGR